MAGNVPESDFKLYFWRLSTILTSQNFKNLHWVEVESFTWFGKNKSTILSANGFIANSGIAMRSSRDK